MMKTRKRNKCKCGAAMIPVCRTYLSSMENRRERKEIVNLVNAIAHTNTEIDRLTNSVNSMKDKNLRREHELAVQMCRVLSDGKTTPQIKDMHQ